MLKKVDKKTLVVIFGVVFTLLISIIIALGVLLGLKTSSKNEGNGGSGEVLDSTTITVLDSTTSNYLARQLLARINFSVDPCENFYGFACGHWHLDHPLPPDEGSWNAEMLISKEVGEDIVDAFKQVDVGSASNGLKFAKNFFDKCMNTDDVEKGRAVWLGTLLHTGQPESPEFHGFEDGSGKWPLIDSSYVDPPISIERQIGLLKNRFGIDSFIYTYVMENEQNSSIINLWLTGQFLPLGLGLGAFSLPFYLDDKFKYVLDAYSQLQQSVSQLLIRDSGFGNIQTNQDDLDRLIQTEKQIAKMINDTIDDEDDQLRNLEELETIVPEFNWKDFFGGLLSDNLVDFVKTKRVLSLNEPRFARELAAFFKTTPRRDLQNFMIWRLIMYNLEYLSSDYKSAYNAFMEVVKGRNLTQPPQQSPQQSVICTSFVRGNFELPNLGYGAAEALSIVKFNQTMRERASNITSNVTNALIDVIQAKSWMDGETKKKAEEKAKLLKKLIAYPDWITNVTAMNSYYEELKASSKVSFGTLNLALRSWAVRKNFDLLTGTSRDEFSFRGSPVLTNAWYEISENSIVIPVGELHSPTFGYDYPSNVVYGALGNLVGHEISHGFFDPDGAAYDGKGNKVDWWSKDSKNNFQKLQACLAKQFDAYCYPDDIGCVNGNQTLGENAADLAGLQIAYKAYQQTTKQELLEVPMFTSDQLFFLSFPIYFCGEQTDASLKKQLIQDGHTPSLFRVNGALRNLKEFADAFSCDKNTFMNPDIRCEI